MSNYNERRLSKDHKNPSYDSNEDGVVEASQLPAVTGLDQGSMTSGDVLKFDGSGLVGGVVETQTPDGKSITKNSNGYLQVEEPSEVLIGDFEVDKGAWTLNNLSRSSTFANTGSYSLTGTLNPDFSGEISASRSISINKDKVRIAVLCDDISSSAISVFVAVGGTVQEQVGLGGLNTDQWYVFELDISSSSYSSIEIGLKSDGSGGNQSAAFFLDTFELFNPQRTVVDGAGN